MNTLIILGSPRRAAGASAGLGNVLGEGLKAKGATVETMMAYGLDDGMFKEALDRSDLVVVSFPVYWDTLPSGVIEAFDKMLAMKDALISKKRGLATICNCGFPSSENCLNALRSVELFGQRMGMEQLGSIAIGQGGALGMGDIHKAVGFKKNLKRLDVVAAHLSKLERIPKEEIDALGKQFVPRFLYIFIGNRSFDKLAKQNGVGKRMDARPYETMK